VADIFLSYAREDVSWASRMAAALAERGWSVFWDRRIPTGKSFDRVIEQELETARCVVVLWSQHSVVSDWVRIEAAEGAARGILHPVWIEDVRVPLEFRRLQTARLVDWRDEMPHAGFDALLADISETLGIRPAGPSVVAGMVPSEGVSPVLTAPKTTTAETPVVESTPAASDEAATYKPNKNTAGTDRRRRRRTQHPEDSLASQEVNDASLNPLLKLGMAVPAVDVAAAEATPEGDAEENAGPGAVRIGLFVLLVLSVVAAAAFLIVAGVVQ
jgi:hypothetical protein